MPKISEKELDAILKRTKCRVISDSGKDLPGVTGHRGRTRSGYRPDLDAFVRSAWEANYFRFLRWLVSQKQIRSVEYETEEFALFRIVKGERAEYRRGNRFYKIDFKLTNLDGSVEYHEVKGYMDATSATKLKRFRRCYPNLVLKIIDAPIYYSIRRSFSHLPFWE